MSRNTKLVTVCASVSILAMTGFSLYRYLMAVEEDEKSLERSAGSFSKSKEKKTKYAPRISTNSIVSLDDESDVMGIEEACHLCFPLLHEKVLKACANKEKKLLLRTLVSIESMTIFFVMMKLGCNALNNHVFFTNEDESEENQRKFLLAVFDLFETQFFGSIVDASIQALQGNDLFAARSLFNKVFKVNELKKPIQSMDFHPDIMKSFLKSFNSEGLNKVFTECSEILYQRFKRKSSESSSESFEKILDRNFTSNGYIQALNQGRDVNLFCLSC